MVVVGHLLAGEFVYAGGRLMAFGVTSGSPGGWPEDPERLRQYQEQQERERLRTRTALERSKALLEEFLDKAQLKEFRAKGTVTVKAKGGMRYRLNPVSAFGIDVLDWRGRVKTQLCLTTDVHVPIYDLMLTQKMMLETPKEEKQVWKIANKKAVGS